MPAALESGQRADRRRALVMENAGICVVKEEVGSAAMIGLSHWSDIDLRRYVLIAADKDTCARSRLDAAHELGHLVRHRRVKEETLADAAAFKEVERQAFLFAGAFLLPGESFASEVWSPSLKGFLPLKARWKVSLGSMIQALPHARHDPSNCSMIFVCRHQMS